MKCVCKRIRESGLITEEGSKTEAFFSQKAEGGECTRSKAITFRFTGKPQICNVSDYWEFHLMGSV